MSDETPDREFSAFFATIDAQEDLAYRTELLEVDVTQALHDYGIHFDQGRYQEALLKVGEHGTLQSAREALVWLTSQVTFAPPQSDDRLLIEEVRAEDQLEDGYLDFLISAPHEALLAEIDRKIAEEPDEREAFILKQAVGLRLNFMVADYRDLTKVIAHKVTYEKVVLEKIMSLFSDIYGPSQSLTPQQRETVIGDNKKRLQAELLARYPGLNGIVEVVNQLNPEGEGLDVIHDAQLVRAAFERRMLRRKNKELFRKLATEQPASLRSSLTIRKGDGPDVAIQKVAFATSIDRQATIGEFSPDVYEKGQQFGVDAATLDAFLVKLMEMPWIG